jgi:hypothetical protein
MLPASEPACEQRAGFLLPVADACLDGVASVSLGPYGLWGRTRIDIAAQRRG